MILSYNVASWELESVTILLVAGLVLVLAGLMLGGERRGQQRGPACPDPSCGYRNPPNARYCARCGRELPAEPQQ
jgi:heme A synthase